MFLKKSINTSLLMGRQGFFIGSKPFGGDLIVNDIFYRKEILGVDRNASEKQIKTAYYKLAREYHPDVNTEKNAHTKFSEINTAYEHMIDSMAQAHKQQKASTQSRNQNTDWNQYHKNYEKAKQQRTKNKSSPPEEDEQISEEDFNQFEKAFRSFINKGKIDPKHRAYSRFFSQFFTHSQDPDEVFNDIDETQDQHFMSSRDQKMVTINAKLNITPEQALNGVTKNILYKKSVTCGSCFGKNPEMTKTKCRKCSGSGFVGRGLDDIRCCNACNGNGTVKNHGCKQCKGRGIMQIYAEEPVRVPTHATQNQQIVLKGRGNQHPKKFYYGDVYIKLKISNKPLVKVDGINTFSTVKLSISDAILGGKIEYPTLKGNKKHDVQKGISDDEEVILKGQGIKKGNKTGDHYLKIKIQIPKTINKKQQDIFIKLRELEKRKSKSSQK